MQATFTRFKHKPENVPDELKSEEVWVVCDEHKAPLIPIRNGACFLAASTKPETWRFYSVAIDTYLNNEHIAGVGRVIRSEEPLVGLDLDDCVDKGEIAPWAHRIVKRVGSYTEISPSLMGIKIWARAPELSTSYVKPGLEIYAGRRYFTVTGLSLGNPEIADTEDALQEIISEEFPRVDRARSYDGHGRVLELEEFLERHGVEVFEREDDATAQSKFSLRCPWVHEHTDQDDSGTYIGQYPTGGLWYHCWHSHCSGRTWRDFKYFALTGKTSRCSRGGGRIR
jgi:hypothetical protein